MFTSPLIEYCVTLGEQTNEEPGNGGKYVTNLASSEKLFSETILELLSFERAVENSGGEAATPAQPASFFLAS